CVSRQQSTAVPSRRPAGCRGLARPQPAERARRQQAVDQPVDRRLERRHPRAVVPDRHLPQKEWRAAPRSCMDRPPDTSRQSREPLSPRLAHLATRDDMNARSLRSNLTALALLGCIAWPAAARAQTFRPTVAIIDFEATPGGWTIPPPRV